MHWAASEGRADVCDVLIRARADVGQQDELGRTAMDYALENGWPALADTLHGVHIPGRGQGYAECHAEGQDPLSMLSSVGTIAVTHTSPYGSVGNSVAPADLRPTELRTLHDLGLNGLPGPCSAPCTARSSGSGVLVCPPSGRQHV